MPQKGLTEEEMKNSIDTIRQMASTLKADISIVREYTLDPLLRFGLNYKVAEVLVRKRPGGGHDDDTEQQFTDLRIVIVGGLGAGKSTLLGHLSHGAKDNGRGRARLNLLRHRHELESGRSSSISHEIVGYDAEGKLINYATTNVSTWEQICESSSKIVTFLDTCGYPKYLRTTISGLMGYAPDYACLVIAGNAGSMTDMAREHLSIAVMLNVPVFVVITKGDLATQDQLRHTLRSLLSIIKSPWMSKVPVVVQNDNDAITCASHFSRRGPELPIFMVSNVTGSNMNLLIKFFNHLPKPKRMDYDELLEEPFEFQIGEVYSLPGKHNSLLYWFLFLLNPFFFFHVDAGNVIGGVLVQGRVNINEDKQYYLGPNAKGEFIKVNVVSIHRHRMPVHYAHCGQTATLALGGMDDPSWKIHKGMVLLGTHNPQCYFEFEAELMVLYHATGVSSGACGMIHSGAIRQRAKVEAVQVVSEESEEDTDTHEITSCSNLMSIQSEQRGICRFKFMYEPCYLRIGSQILFMEEKSKCLGRVTRVFPIE